jgi:hypothetical protein
MLADLEGLPPADLWIKHLDAVECEAAEMERERLRPLVRQLFHSAPIGWGQPDHPEHEAWVAVYTEFQRS